MDLNRWIEQIEGMAGIYSFDIMPDGSYSEIRLLAINSQNTGIMYVNPDAPAFYPGIAWRKYFVDINFESFVYRCAGTNNQLYSYVNAHGYWLKGFYLPLHLEDGADPCVSPDAEKTVYCLYVGTVSPEVEPEFMSQQSSAVSSAVMNTSIKLHQTQNFERAMAAAVGEIKKACGSGFCALYVVDQNKQECMLIGENGVEADMLAQFSAEIGRTPYEIAQAWENDLADSDCLMPENMAVVRERDPAWYDTLIAHGVNNIVLYAVRCNQALVGFIWASQFDAAQMVQIKEILELTSFLIGAVISNHQFVRRLEVMSRVDGLTQVWNRNALNDRTERLRTGADAAPGTLGILFADLNGLKTVNDNEGHEAGDKLLSRAAALLKIAFVDYEIYRAGGDEFVVLCPGITAEKLEQQALQLRALADTTPDVSFALGTAHVTGEYDVSRAMQTADENMYRDKEEYYRRHPEKNRRKAGKP